MQRAVAGIHKFIGNAKLDAARRLIRDAYFGLPIGKVIARAERMNAARREANARAERERQKETRDPARIQDEAILPTGGVQVKSHVGVSGWAGERTNTSPGSSEGAILGGRASAASPGHPHARALAPEVQGLKAIS